MQINSNLCKVCWHQFSATKTKQPLDHTMPTVKPMADSITSVISVFGNSFSKAPIVSPENVLCVTHLWLLCNIQIRVILGRGRGRIVSQITRSSTVYLFGITKKQIIKFPHRCPFVKEITDDRCFICLQTCCHCKDYKDKPIRTRGSIISTLVTDWIQILHVCQWNNVWTIEINASLYEMVYG